MKPVLAVDVDGVLNALSTGPRPPRGWQDAQVNGFRVRVSPHHGTRLLAIARDTGADLVWCTTWEEMANEHIAPLLGLPGLPWVPLMPGLAEAQRGLESGEQASTGACKGAALRLWAGDRPVCWLDDEPDAVAGLASWKVPHLVVQIRGAAGLQEHHLARAARWLASRSLAA